MRTWIPLHIMMMTNPNYAENFLIFLPVNELVLPFKEILKLWRTTRAGEEAPFTIRRPSIQEF